MTHKAAKTHTATEWGTLCSSTAITARVGSTTCSKCNSRMAELTNFLFATARGEDTTETAVKLMRKWKLSEVSDVQT